MQSLSNLTAPLETATRKKIDQMLNNKDWLTDELSDNYNVYTERVKTKQQTEKLKKISGYKKPPDYVLYETDTDNPIAVIEAKRKGQSVDDALKQAIKKYAKDQIDSVFYIHSWELTPEFMPRLSLPAFSKFVTYYNIEKAFPKMDKLIKKFEFTSFEQYLKSM